MAKRLRAFPEAAKEGGRRYPWLDWADGSVWEIRQGEDYDVSTESMRVAMHLKAGTLHQKVKTRKLFDKRGEGLVFQFTESDEMKEVRMSMTQDPESTRRALAELERDALQIYETARREVTIEKKDGTRQKYAATRYKQQIEKGSSTNLLVPTIARILRRHTVGFGHLERARRKDLMLEMLVLDTAKPYHRLFSPTTIQVAKDRMDAYDRRHCDD